MGKRRRKQKRSTRRTGRPSKQSTRRPPDRATNPIIPWLHGLAAMGNQRWDEAALAFRRYLEMSTNPEDRKKAYQNLSGCYLEMERYDEALAALDKVERHTPDDPGALHARGVIYANAGRVSDAIAAFERFIHRWPRLVDPETRETLRELRRIQRGEIPAGTYLLEYLKEQVVNDVELGDFHLVEQKAKRMIAADPDRPEGHFALGVACLEQGRCQEALEALLAALDRDPDYPPALYNIGHAYQKLEEPEQAIPWLERVLQLEPRYPAALYHMGLACEKMGRPDEAVSWWRRTLRVEPSNYAARQKLYEAGLGPDPAGTPQSLTDLELRSSIPAVKERMKRPEVYRNGSVTLSVDEEVGFVLEDAENRLNASIYTGGSFQVGSIPTDEDLLDMMGVIKFLLRSAHPGNTRAVAVLVYYEDRPAFFYRAVFKWGERTKFEAEGQFVTTEVPRLFKVRVDSDISTAYGDPMQGMLIYLGQGAEPGVLINTLALEPKRYSWTF